MLDNKRKDNITRNRAVLKRIVESVLFCGRQCIGLRGDGEGPSYLEAELVARNPGNFRALLNVVAEHDAVLKEHLEHPALKNCTYTSPKIQNDIINIIGKDIIQKLIIEEVKEAKFFTVMANEVTLHNLEELAICLRFVYKKCNIRKNSLISCSCNA